MDRLKNYLTTIQIAKHNDNVYKDECVYSYDTPVSFI